LAHGTERSRSRCRLRTRGAVSERLRLINDFSTAFFKAMGPLEEPAPIVTFSAALRNGAWLGVPPPKCACLTSETRSIAQAETAADYPPERKPLFRVAWMTLSPYRSRRGLLTMGNYLDKNSRSLRRRGRRPSYAHTVAPVLGPRAVTLGGGGESRPVGRRVVYC
jgi:hypothetical protein